MTVCVAVVVKDRREQLTRCLDALDAQTRSPDQLLVVDNGSTDGTWELLQSRGVTAVRAPGTLGAARQAAVEACTEDLLAFTDSDCRPRPDWLQALVAAADPDVDVVQGRTVPEPGEPGRWSVTQQIETFTELYECCNLLYRVEALRSAGGFDPRTGFFGEDTAAGWRVRRLGGRSAFARQAVVEHDLTHPGPGWWVRRGLMFAAFPRLVREFPEMREQLLYRRYLLRRKSLPVLLATGGVLTAVVTGKPLALAAVLPWTRASWSAEPGLEGLRDTAAVMLRDAANLTGLVYGSVKERRVVL